MDELDALWWLLLQSTLHRFFWSLEENLRLLLIQASIYKYRTSLFQWIQSRYFIIHFLAANIIVSAFLLFHCLWISKVAVRRIIGGKWGCNNGQACISPDYIIITKDYAPKLVKFPHLPKNSEYALIFFFSFPLKLFCLSRLILWKVNWRNFMGRIRWNQKTCLALWTPTTFLAWRNTWMRTRFLVRLSMEANGTKPTCEFY